MSRPTDGASHKDVAVEFLRLAASGKAREAFETCVAPRFIHHDAHLHGDAESLMEAMDQNARENPEKVLEVQHAIEQGDLVAVHSRVRHKPGDPGVAVFHLFRFSGDRIVELWDVGREAPAESPNEHGMF